MQEEHTSRVLCSNRLPVNVFDRCYDQAIRQYIARSETRVHADWIGTYRKDAATIPKDGDTPRLIHGDPKRGGTGIFPNELWHQQGGGKWECTPVSDTIAECFEAYTSVMDIIMNNLIFVQPATIGIMKSLW
jgi:hypothetical protein